MDYEIILEPFPHVVIKNYYTESELKDIWKELEFITDDSKLGTVSESSGAVDERGTHLKRNKALFLDMAYRNRDMSYILRYNRKFLTNKTFRDELAKNNWFLALLSVTNQDSTLVSYYENGDCYNAHRDLTVITAVTHLYKEPRKFSGGDISFPEFNYEVPMENNRVILFPSTVMHQVSEIKMNQEDMGKCMGRYCISQFLGVGIFK